MTQGTNTAPLRPSRRLALSVAAKAPASSASQSRLLRSPPTPTLLPPAALAPARSLAVYASAREPAVRRRHGRPPRRLALGALVLPTAWPANRFGPSSFHACPPSERLEGFAEVPRLQLLPSYLIAPAQHVEHAVELVTCSRDIPPHLSTLQSIPPRCEARRVLLFSALWP